MIYYKKPTRSRGNRQEEYRRRRTLAGAKRIGNGESGSGFAGRAARDAKREPLPVDWTDPPDPEIHRLQKLEESRLERERVQRMKEEDAREKAEVRRREADERRAAKTVTPISPPEVSPLTEEKP